MLAWINSDNDHHHNNNLVILHIFKDMEEEAAWVAWEIQKLINIQAMVIKVSLTIMQCHPSNQDMVIIHHLSICNPIMLIKCIPNSLFHKKLLKLWKKNYSLKQNWPS